MNEALLSSKKMDWETPPEFFDPLNQEFKFTLDAAATPSNAKIPNFITPEMDALKQPWPGRVWLNPPYGRAIGKFVEKAYRESRTNAELVVMLIPARTDTAYWHDFVMKAKEVRFIRGRIKFIGREDGTLQPAPFPSAIVVFKDDAQSEEVSQ